MDFIIIPATFFIVAFFLYKFFELLICRKERRAIVDKIDSNLLLEYVKHARLGFDFGNLVSSVSTRLSYPASWSLRIGSLIFGMGLGLVVGNVLDACLHGDMWSYSRNMIVGGSVLCLGGLGLLVAFAIEYRMYKSMRKEGE